MTKLLEKAFAEATRLPDEEQDALAQAVLAGLASGRRWDDLFAGSAEVPGGLAEEAFAEHRAGRSKPRDPDAL